MQDMSYTENGATANKPAPIDFISPAAMPLIKKYAPPAAATALELIPKQKRLTLRVKMLKLSPLWQI